MTDLPTSLPEASLEERLQTRIRNLSREVWDSVIEGADVNRWLANFDGSVLDVDTERLYALHLLSHFNYFGIKEIREMLRSVYRDLFRYPLIQQARVAQNDTRDFATLEASFQEELRSTRFLGMGNPSESGAHLLYYFRQMNKLPKSLFIHQHEILNHAPGVAPNEIAIPGLKRLVFVDDLMGSGQQAQDYSHKLLEFVREAAKSHPHSLEIWYFTLFARPNALSRVRLLPFDRVETIHEVDDAEQAFSNQSRVFVDPPPGFTLAEAQALASAYGSKLVPGHPLGYKNGQLLLGFQHNVPDNSLPIFWLNDTKVQWDPVFPRFDKVYG
ncbi:MULTISPECIES: hypothetical protein [unclassified Rathayibacter]|uniref:phosphoribosyltransferase-like protein n=1 Tax=unclassified Rathayibacter TaxID=2609250 RepID=UPI0011AFF091|nr:MULTISPECIES: hypothetical protein [unclassified Rathayibacter]